MKNQPIDWNTGELLLGGKRLIVGPYFTYEHLRRVSFRWRVKISHCRPAEGPVIHFAKLRRPRKFGGILFEVLLEFLDSRLDTIDLCALTYPDGRRWDKRTDLKETIRRDIHEEWLESILGPPPKYFEYSFPWGTVTSANDPREESEACVKIKYRKKREGSNKMPRHEL
jgi:hypothetical protein